MVRALRTSQTQRGQSPEGRTRPSVVKGLRTSQDPVWSKARGPDKTQRGQSPEGQIRPSEVRVLRATTDPARSKAWAGRQDLARSEPSVSVKSRHETVPQPEGQCANRPVCLVTQPSPVCCHRPRASRSSSRGRGVGLVFLFLAPSFSSLFFRFSVLVSRGFSWSRGCAVATPAIRGVSRGGCAASPSSGKVPPDL